MCGIIGYTGTGDAEGKIIKGLGMLEYRGYDSAGIAADTGDGIKIVKCSGRITALREKLRLEPIGKSSCAVGHTRWATHGAPSEANAHPHRAGKTVLVHNGIIENYSEIREQLEGEYCFISETDTEAAAALIDRYYSKLHSAVGAITAACGQMKGSYAFAVMFDDLPGEVYAVRKDSPLMLGKGADGFCLASDLTALAAFADEYCSLGENECARLTPGQAEIVINGAMRLPVWRKNRIAAEDASKGEFAHFMEKEMYEQPDAVVRAVSPRVKNGLPDLSGDGVGRDYLGQVKKIRIIACGSAMHAGLLGTHFFRETADVECEVSIASEYRYYPPADEEGTLVVPISQSGETADTIAALRYAKKSGFDTLAIVNAPDTTAAREADRRMYTCAGPEIAVATTKGYCTQAALLCIMAAAMGLAKGHITAQEAKKTADELLNEVPDAMRAVFAMREQIKAQAARIAEHDHAFFIGRGPDYALAQEGALKLKEISYIHAEAYAAGELKHGTISLIGEGTPVAAITACEKTAKKTAGNIREVKSRGAYVISLSQGADPYADSSILLPDVSETGRLFASLAALQMLAYETAVIRGCDIDKPRNLAKSVTVE